MRRVCLSSVLLSIALSVTSASAPRARLQASGTQFLRDGRPFAWRGITAFRLVEQVASGRETDAEKFLAWSEAHDVTIVRVLAMAKQAFELAPANGVEALPKLLALAAKHDLQVEVVALADTASYQFDVEKHVAAIGQACATTDNCVIEIANEPYHPTQSSPVHDRAYLARLRTLIPRDIPVALGAGNEPQDSGGGDFATIHASRDTGNGGWAYVKAIAALKGLPERMKMPVVSDEPIGAGERLEPGRRDNDPARFEAFARATREAGLGATFHYSDGINAVIPTGRQLACFDAWRRGMTNR